MGVQVNPTFGFWKDHCSYQSTFTVVHAVHNATRMERIALITLAQSPRVMITPTLLHMECARLLPLNWTYFMMRNYCQDYSYPSKNGTFSVAYIST